MKAVWIGILGIGVLACSEDKQVAATNGSSPDGGRGGTAGSGGKGGGGAPSGDTAKLHWQVAEFSTDPTPVAIADVDVCVLDHDEIPCVKSDKDGNFDLAGLPRDTALDITFKKAGYAPTLKSIETSNIDMDGTGNPPINLFVQGPPPADLGFTVDAAKGSLNFFVIGPAEAGFGPLVGSTATISPNPGNGPIYYGADGTYDVTAKSTYSFGGNFFNLDEGEYKITVKAPPGNDCAGISFPFSGWGVPVANEPAIKARVVPGFITWQVGVFCTVGMAGGGGDAAVGKDASSPSKDASTKD